MVNSKKSETLKRNFRDKLVKQIELFDAAVSTQDGDWVVKGFIDIAKNIYAISIDTKVVSKVMEILLVPKICEFAEKNSLKIVFCKEQNFYPDVTFVDCDNNKFAVDIKSTYRKNDRQVNGLTLGAFTGYFRNRSSKKNIMFPYEEYAGHFVLGVLYSRMHIPDERRIYRLDELQNITSAIRNCMFFVQEKYKIASDRPGSGNTKNFGSVTKVHELVKGEGPFTKLGEDVFDDYWMYYLTKEMARAIELETPPYRNIQEYIEYKKLER